MGGIPAATIATRTTILNNKAPTFAGAALTTNSSKAGKIINKMYIRSSHNLLLR